MKKTIGALACALVMAAAPAVASASASTTSTTRVSATDTAWLQAAIQADMAQVQASQLAESKTTNKAALALAGNMISTHSEMLSKAERVAQQLGVAIPTATSTVYATELSQLSTLSGRAFVIAYAKDEVNGCEQFIGQTEQEIKSGENLRVRVVASFYLGIDEMHLGLAEGVATAMRLMTS